MKKDQLATIDIDRAFEDKNANELARLLTHIAQQPDANTHDTNQLLSREIDGLPILHWAASHGHLALLKACLTLNPELTQTKDKQQHTPLMLATQNNHTDCIITLIDARPDTLTMQFPIPYKHANDSVVYEPGPGIVHTLIFNENVIALEHAILKCKEMGIDLLALQDQTGQFPHYLALDEDNADIVSVFLEQYPKLYEITSTPSCAFAETAAQGGRAKCLELLVSNNPNLITAPITPEQYTLSLILAKQGHVRPLESWVRQHPDILRQQTKKRETLAHLAASHGHTAILDACVSQDPSVLLAVNEYGQTPLFKAFYKKHDACATRLLSLNPDALLIKNRNNHSILYHLASTRRIKQLEGVIEVSKQHNFDLLETTTRRPQHFLALINLAGVETLNILRRYFPKLLHLQNSAGDTVVTYAAREKRLDALIYCINNDASVLNQSDQNGDNLAQIAVRNYHTQLSLELIKHAPLRFVDSALALFALNKQNLTVFNACITQKPSLLDGEEGKEIIQALRQIDSTETLIKCIQLRPSILLYQDAASENLIIPVLRHAMEMQHIELLSRCLNVSPDTLNARDAQGESPALFAARMHLEFSNHAAFKALCMMIETNPNVLFQVDHEGNSCLEYLARSPNIQGLEACIQARPNRMDETGLRSVGFADGRSNEELYATFLINNPHLLCSEAEVREFAHKAAMDDVIEGLRAKIQQLGDSATSEKQRENIFAALLACRSTELSQAMRVHTLATLYNYLAAPFLGIQHDTSNLLELLANSLQADDVWKQTGDAFHQLLHDGEAQRPPSPRREPEPPEDAERDWTVDAVYAIPASNKPEKEIDVIPSVDDLQDQILQLLDEHEASIALNQSVSNSLTSLTQTKFSETKHAETLQILHNYLAAHFNQDPEQDRVTPFAELIDSLQSNKRWKQAGDALMVVGAIVALSTLVMMFTMPAMVVGLTIASLVNAGTALSAASLITGFSLWAGNRQQAEMCQTLEGIALVAKGQV